MDDETPTETESPYCRDDHLLAIVRQMEQTRNQTFALLTELVATQSQLSCRAMSMLEKEQQ